jgi:chromate transporter
LAIAWAYVRFGYLPQGQALLYGLKPAILAIVFQAIWALGRTAYRSAWLVALGGLSLAGSLAGLHPLAVLLGAGILAAGARAARHGGFGRVAALA